FRLRGGYERAVRAPNIGELFGGAVADPPFIGFTFQGLGDPCDILSRFRSPANPDAAKVAALCIQQGVPAALINSFTFPVPQVGGEEVSNPSLVPETADTFTLGGAWRRTFGQASANGLSISVDYYHIHISNAITYVPAQLALYNCFNELNANPTFDPNSFYCKQITRSPGGEIVNLNTQVVNSGGIKTDGVDFQLDWVARLDQMGLGSRAGSFDLNVVGTWLHSFQIAQLAGSPFLEYAGTLGGSASPLPKWRFNATLTWTSGGVSVGARWNFLDAMASSTAVTSPGNVLPGVPSYSTFDLFARVEVMRRFELRGGIDNLLDKAPLIVNGEPGNTDPAIYDVLGRRFFVGLTAKF
ncbi:MAG: TonB-dependent receptor domain-containing protein, partial [Caulobacteraceae bacterium]